MATDVSISISVKDNYSKVMETLKKATKDFGNDITGVQKKLDMLNKSKSTIQVEVASAKKNLVDLKKAFMDTGTDEAKEKLKQAQEEYNNLASSLKQVETKAKDAERELRSLNGTGAMSTTGSGQSGETGLTGILEMQGVSQALTAAFSLGGNVASTRITSAYGEEAGIMADAIISGVGSWASTGALIGTFFGPLGTLIGGGIGALVGIGAGAIEGDNQIFANRDDFFKSLKKDKYDEAQGLYDERITQGGSFAAQQEMDMLAFEKLLGSRDIADTFLADLVEKAKKTPFGYGDLTGMSKTLATFGYAQDEMLTMIDKIGNMGAALGMDATDMSMVGTYIGRMKSSGKTTLEWLNPLVERGIPVIDYLSEALSKSKGEVYDMISKGLIPGEKSAKIIADYMGRDFAGSMEAMSRTYEGMMSTVGDYEEQQNAAMGIAYNDERVKGLQKQIDWYESEYGNEMKEVYARAGKLKAQQENESEEQLRKAYNEFLDNDWSSLTDEDFYAKFLGLEAEGYVNYLQTTTYDVMYNGQMQLVEDITTALCDEYEKAGYILAQAFTDGLKSANLGSTAAYQEWADTLHVNLNEYGIDEDFFSYDERTGSWRDVTGFYYSTEKAREITEQSIDKRKKIYEDKHGKAFGFSYVPYNDYPARLHEGERVLTASQNREYMSGTHGNVTVNVSSLVVRENADVDRIADELYRKIRLASSNYSDLS